jgi:hypothetical protein
VTTSHDEICPPYIGEQRFTLSLVSTAAIQAFSRQQLTIDYSGAEPDGVVLPLEMIVQGPSRSSYQRRVYSRAKPTSLFITPREGGPHLVLLREFAHNKWWGRVTLNVEGPSLENSST